MHGHILVWVDHKSARLFRIDRNSHEAAGAGPNQIIHHQTADHDGRADDKSFFSDIAAGLSGTSGVLIVGPGEEKTHLSKWLTERCPDIAKNIWAIQAIDHPSNAQLIVHGRTYFSAEEKMRA